MKSQIALLVLGLSCGALVLSAEPADEKVVWHADWPTAQRIARKLNKPIFAVLVCKHWRDEKGFDEQVVRLHPEIRALALEYVLLRPGNMRGLDLFIFDFDFDLPWHALFITPEGQVLGRFGGRDAETPAKYLTMTGLRHSLDAGLKRHQSAPQEKLPPGRKPLRAEDYPAAAKRSDNACIHCHHVYEFRRDALQRVGRWSLDDVWVYPQPENIGLALDLAQGDRIAQVQPKSPAAKAGLKAKDLLRRINDVPIASSADVQYALQQAPKRGELSLVWQSGSQVMKSRMPLPENWRQTDVSWRWSLKSMSPSPGVVGDDLNPEERAKLGLDPRQLAYRHMNFLPPAARHAGLQTNDIILGIDDQSLIMTARQFEAHLRLHHRVGQEITLNVLRGMERMKLKLKLPE